MDRRRRGRDDEIKTGKDAEREIERDRERDR